MSLRPDCIFENHQLWQSGFSRLYSNSYCSYSFKAEIIKIGQSSHKMYCNNILNFQVSMTILNACTKKVWKLIEGTTYIYIYIYIYIYPLIHIKNIGGLFAAGLPTGGIVLVGLLVRMSMMLEKPETCKNPKNITDEVILLILTVYDYNRT